MAFYIVNMYIINIHLVIIILTGRNPEQAHIGVTLLQMGGQVEEVEKECKGRGRDRHRSQQHCDLGVVTTGSHDTKSPHQPDKEPEILNCPPINPFN